ncbi:helix-turn-helix transcriptional regulator [Deinococcus sp.]|uniref:helix-turn-helix transcriptional regulator n=1 Tax=Deinococcus sp. TaxID=47478 RepID=UPI003CC5B241
MYDPTMRVMTVLEMLQARPKVTAAELAARLEVHPRTVQRYIARLQDLGVPVTSTRGIGSAYSLRPGFRLPPMMFSDGEALALTLGLRALAHLGFSAFAPATEGARAKLSRVLPGTVAGRVQALEAAMEFDTPPRTVTADAARVIALADAVQGRQPLRLSYAAHGEPGTLREVEPYGVVHYDARWYLVGYCRLRAATRSFRIDRIREVAELEGTFVIPSGFDAAQYLRETLPFAPSPREMRVRLGLPLSAALTRVPHAKAVLEADGNATLMRCGVDDLEWFAATLLTLGCTVEVLGPPELRDAFGRVAQRASEVFQAAAALPDSARTPQAG